VLPKPVPNLAFNWSWGLDPQGLAIRTAVFVEEQAVPPELERDEQDDIAWQLVAYGDQLPLGTLRIFQEPDGQWYLGRMAILKPWRGLGYGSLLIQAAQAKALELKAPALHIHAQVQAMPFYAKQGFQPYGETFMEAGILHQMMVLALR